ncbi:MAG: PAS domain-containing sensor histidine kinase [Anaerolineales bacterium]
MTGIERTDQDHSKWFVGLWIAIVVFYFAWVIVEPHSDARPAWSLLITFGLRSWTTGALILASVRANKPSRIRTWRFISLAFVCWTIIDGMYLTYWLTDADLPGVPHWTDAVRLCAYLATMIVTFSYPTAPVERLGRTRDQLDIVLTGAAVMGLAWLTFLLPILSVRFLNPVAVFWRSLFPIFDLLLFVYFARLFLLAEAERDRKILAMLTLATLFLGISDLLFGVLSLQGSYSPGGLVEVGWMIGSGFYYFAALITIRDSRPRTEPEKNQHTLSRRIGRLIPVGLTGMVIGYLLLDWWMGGQIELVGVALVALLGALFVARQGVIAGQMEFLQYASLVTNSEDMAFVCDLEGKLLLANPSLLRDLGLEVGDWKTRKIQDLVRNPTRWERVGEQARENGWSGELTFRRKDGSTFPAALAIRPIEDERKSQVLLAGTAHDLTQVKERENALHDALRQVAAARAELEGLNIALEEKVEHRTQELEQTIKDLARLNKELKELDTLKTEFVALVSHELRAPLTNISAGIELILSGHPKMKVQTADSLKLVQAEIKRLSKLVDTILDISSLEAGRFPFDLCGVAIGEIAKRVCDRFTDGDHADRFEIRIPDGLTPALADEHALESIFQHLLDNALKYALEGDIILEGWSDENYLWIAVDDGGMGIPETERERIFDMFHRLDTRDDRDVYGYGLGLSMVKRLLEAMQGGIRVEESQRGGARFVFWLPIQEEVEDI